MPVLNALWLPMLLEEPGMVSGKQLFTIKCQSVVCDKKLHPKSCAQPELAWGRTGLFPTHLDPNLHPPACRDRLQLPVDHSEPHPYSLHTTPSLGVGL